ncbi:hypothetical protein PG996_006132 [Apiospora saccharicola]|uniref:Uncharacterized protein n=1 Tax=Apiospora saccharicola TaxID=335842 RepID=A0ABR1VSA0_9PEZI
MLPLQLIIAVTGLTGLAAAGPVDGRSNALNMRDDGSFSNPGLLEKRCTECECPGGFEGPCCCRFSQCCCDADDYSCPS